MKIPNKLKEVCNFLGFWMVSIIILSAIVGFICLLIGIFGIGPIIHKDTYYPTTFTLNGNYEILTKCGDDRCYGRDMEYSAACGAESIDYGFCSYVLGYKDNQLSAIADGNNYCINGTTFDDGYYKSNQCYTKEKNYDNEIKHRKKYLELIMIGGIMMIPVFVLLIGMTIYSERMKSLENNQAGEQKISPNLVENNELLIKDTNDV